MLPTLAVFLEYICDQLQTFFLKFSPSKLVTLDIMKVESPRNQEALL